MQNIIVQLQCELRQCYTSGKSSIGVLAKDLGLSSQTVSRFIYAETKFPRAATVATIAEYLGYSFVLQRQCLKVA